MDLFLATANVNKIKELENLLKDTKWNIKSLKDFPNMVMPPETESTFQGNAAIKAKAGASFTNLWSIADDSGLEVDWLNGEPGVYSARYAGLDQNDARNNQKLIGAMADCPEDQRQARFVSAIVLVSPEGEEFTSIGTCEGTVGYEPKGENGFGYDCLFIIDGLNKTMAEISMAEKNQISHRAKALQGMAKILVDILVREQ